VLRLAPGDLPSDSRLTVGVALTLERWSSALATSALVSALRCAPDGAPDGEREPLSALALAPQE